MPHNSLFPYAPGEDLDPRPTLLVVDDDPDILRVVQYALRKGNYEVFTATGGSEALEILSHNEQIELVLSDVMMPGMSGLEFLEKLRQEHRVPRLPFILISAENETSKKVEGLGKGADDYITKPFSLDELRVKVHNHVRSYRLHRDLITAHKQTEQVADTLKMQKELLERDLDAARAVQLGLLPTSFPGHESYKIGATYGPADRLGGDFYDVVHLEAKNKLGIFIADVSGHGVVAALVTSMTKVAFQNAYLTTEDPGQVIRVMNDELQPILSKNEALENAFVTAVYIVLDLDTLTMSYASGGHPPLLIHRRSTEEMISLEPQATFLGAFEGVEFPSTVVPLKSEDRVLFYTDGIFESQRLDGEDFGMERVKAELVSQAGTPVEEALNHLLNQLKIFMDGRDFDDDITLLGLDIT